MKLVSIHKLKYSTFLLVLLCFAVFGVAKAQEQKTFSNLSEVLSLAKQRNYLFKNADLQTKLAELTTKNSFAVGYGQSSEMTQESED